MGSIGLSCLRGDGKPSHWSLLLRMILGILVVLCLQIGIACDLRAGIEPTGGSGSSK